MNTITVEITQYQFEEVPGKGKCLIPISPPKPLITALVGTKLKCKGLDSRGYMVVKTPYLNNSYYYCVVIISDPHKSVIGYSVGIRGGISFFTTLEELNANLNAVPDWSLA